MNPLSSADEKISRYNLVIIAVALIIPTLMSIPVLTGYLATRGTDKVFLGFIRPDDFHRYASFMKQAAGDGVFLFDEFSSVEGQGERIPALFFTIMGRISGITGIPEALLWMISRTILGACLLGMVFLLARRLFARERTARLVLLLAAFSGGFQWIFLTFFRHAGEGAVIPRAQQWWMDGMSTFEVMHNPLKVAGLLGMVIFLWTALTYRRTGRIRYGALTAVLMFLTWLLHPMTAVVGFAALFIMPVIAMAGNPSRRTLSVEIPRLLPLVVPVTIAVVMVGWMRMDPGSAHTISAHRLVLGPLSIPGYFVHYGAVLPLGILGMWRVCSIKNPGWELLPAWIIAAVSAQQNPWVEPLLFQHTLHIPLCFLAAPGIEYILDRLSTKNILQRGFIMLLAGLFAVQMVFDVAAISRQTVNDVWPSSLYMDRDDWALCRHLENLPDGNVLATADTGNKIAWLSQKRVLLGHWGTTPDKETKQHDLAMFFSPDTTVRQKKTILKRYHIAYVFYGKREQQMGSLDEALDLIELYRVGGAVLYTVSTDNPKPLTLKTDSL